jgi:aminoglycoside phosphotransferase (APT) family kinase protein
MLCFPNLPQVLANGKVLWEGQSRMVIKLEGEVVVKIGHDLDHGEDALLSFIAQEAPDVPIPRPLGTIVTQDMTYQFMTIIPGVTLDECWPRLSMEQKASICSQLNHMMSALRRVPYVSSHPLGSISTPHLCADNRMRKRQCSHPLFTESEFNDFLVSRPFRRVSPGYARWIRSLLRNDHRIVLTHGDFHPRNIMVVENEDHGVIVSGIIDWEMGGWYPEHWELVKAQNTRGRDDDSDWWESLPESISGYDTEVVVDTFLESFMNVF